MFSDPHFPWVFRRNEIDLLEEDIDALYDFYGSASKSGETIEQMIIDEQIETEDQADAEFARSVDLRLFSPTQTHWNVDREQYASDQDLILDTERPPFYEHLFHYAEAVYQHATQMYEKHQEDREHAFRIRLNVKMIPVKCAAAMSDELHEDPLSKAMALKQYKLGIIYFDRTLVSLAYLVAKGDEVAGGFIKPGMHMKSILQQHLTRLENHKRGPWPSYE